MKPQSKQVMRWAAFPIIFLMLSGCASMKAKFNPSVKANVGIFADNTLAMLDATGFGFTKKKAVYTKEFFENGAEERRFYETRDGVERVLKAMMSYSLKLVSISDMHKNAEDQVKAYTAYLGQIDDTILEALGLKTDYYKELITEVGEQKKLMDALKTAQPIVDALGRYMEKALDELEDAVEILLAKVDRKIDLRYADLIRYQAKLEKEKYAILSGLEHLYLTGQGDKDAYRRLKYGETTIPKSMIPDDRPTYEELWQIARHQIDNLDTLHKIVVEIQPDWELYRETHLELDKLQDELNTESRQMRLLTLVWIRAHQKMASGITSSAEWFNINEAPSTLIKLGAKTIF